jgi:hypothetical protein
MTDSTVADVLLALRLRGVVEGSVVAARAGLRPERAVQVLVDCVDAGWAQRSEGRLAGWALTAAGRRHGEQLLSAELDALGARAPLESAYLRFVELNGALLSVCTAWQVVTVDGVEVPNDHSDPARDADVLATLGALHEQAAPLTTTIGELVERFAGYRPRLDAAHRRVTAGEHEWLTRPTIDSYHTVWFELHEHLLATLGRSRTDERNQTPGGEPGAPAERSAPHEEYA